MHRVTRGPAHYKSVGVAKDLSIRIPAISCPVFRSSERTGTTLESRWFSPRVISFEGRYSVVSKAVDDTRDQTQIVLALQRAGRVGKRRALIISLNADSKRSEEGVLESSANCV